MPISTNHVKEQCFTKVINSILNVNWRVEEAYECNFPNREQTKLKWQPMLRMRNTYIHLRIHVVSRLLWPKILKNKNSAQFSFLSSQYLPGGFTTFLPVKGRHYRGVSPVSMPVEFESNGCVDLWDCYRSSNLISCIWTKTLRMPNIINGTLIIW